MARMLQIKVTATGEPDALPLVRKYQFLHSEDDLLVASLAKVKDTLAMNRRINVNDALLLYGGYVAVMTNGGTAKERIVKGVSLLLSENQVMIGVAEMTRKVTVEIDVDGLASKVTVCNPIPILRYDIRSVKRQQDSGGV